MINIRVKTLSVIAFSVVISIFGNWLVLEQLAYPTFAKLEERAAFQNTQRALEAISSEVENISITLWDYSNWDDAYDFAMEQFSDFAGNNLNYDNLSKFSIDIVEAYDQKGRLIFANQLSNKKTSDAWLLSSLYPQLILAAEAGSDVGEKKGILISPDGIIMFAARPVLKTSGEGPPAGLFIFGRFLDKVVSAEIKRKTKIDFDLVSVEEALASDRSNLVAEVVKEGAPLVVRDDQRDLLLTYSIVHDFFGSPAVVVKSSTRRDITASGRQVIWASMAGIAVSGLVVMGATVLLLQWLVIGPLVGFTQQVVAIGRNGNWSQRVALARGDEIGVLSREFGKMLGRLAQARDQLLEQSYNSGLAEMAAGVLHNLRNHMTPMSMRIGRLHNKLSKTSVPKLSLACDELIRQYPAGERKDKLEKYIKLSLREMAERNEGTVQRLELIADDLRRLDEALGELDRFGRPEKDIATVDVGRVLRETISNLPDFPDLDVNINIDEVVEGGLMVSSPPFVLKHIFHNLFVNSCEAILATGRRTGNIKVVQGVSMMEGAKMLDLQVSDDGIGIARENIGKIFSRGFTTKYGGRRGTGLHWCANAISNMGGRLIANSAGVGCGSVFHVLLPFADNQINAAA